ncbi:hypothetical protein ZIOFF_036340 [Zingiber officinale]|uniref:Uncharacterized protein n=1 Tax=Zingiber officinale TaxID=94328 RepID=A0A8J5GDN1_ZINOF|nr:hypothetical protein ZIOFF_036340 [Zingiber officinale]
MFTFCYESSRKKAKAVAVLCGFGNSGVAGVVHFSQEGIDGCVSTGSCSVFRSSFNVLRWISCHHLYLCSGPHYNPTGEEHGDPGDPIDDLGNVVAGDGGIYILI